MIAIYHVVKQDENFETAAQMVFQLVSSAQKNHPNLNRELFLDIDGHRDKEGSFDCDMFELQKDFIIDFLLDYLTEVHLPIGTYSNSKQKNDVPDELMITNA